MAHFDEYQAPNEYDNIYIRMTNIQHISYYFNDVQSFLISFNYIDPKDRLQQVLHWFQFPHLHISGKHQSTIYINISTCFTTVNFFENEHRGV